MSIGYSSETSDNPFKSNGELSQKADFMLRNSTITRTAISIADPDTSADTTNHEEFIQSSASALNSAPPQTNGDTTPQQIEVKLTRNEDLKPSKAEKVEATKAKCCTVM